MRSRVKLSGFTIVEILIVVVVIAILASISMVAYGGVQARARDAQRQQDTRIIAQALEMYYLDNGNYPAASCSANCVVNEGWSTTNDGSWSNLASALVPKYISELPSDPKPTTGSSPVQSGNYGYAYFRSRSGGLAYCGAPHGRMYILVYTLEASDQRDKLVGSCTVEALGPYLNKSNYRVANGGA